jgi:hypothetical protein
MVGRMYVVKSSTGMKDTAKHFRPVQYLQEYQCQLRFAGTAPDKAIEPEDVRASRHPAKTLKYKKNFTKPFFKDYLKACFVTSKGIKRKRS